MNESLYLITGFLVGRESDVEIIVFETLGVAVQDLVTAKHIYDRDVKENVGTRWDESV